LDGSIIIGLIVISDDVLSFKQESEYLKVEVSNIQLIEQERASGKRAWRLHTREGKLITVLDNTSTFTIHTYFGQSDISLNGIEKLVTWVVKPEDTFQRPQNPLVKTVTSSSGATYKTVNGLLPEPIWLP
jgi:hypothetical protein